MVDKVIKHVADAVEGEDMANRDEEVAVGVGGKGEALVEEENEAEEEQVLSTSETRLMLRQIRWNFNRTKVSQHLVSSICHRLSTKCCKGPSPCSTGSGE